jgi:hypothetical protein
MTVFQLSHVQEVSSSSFVKLFPFLVLLGEFYLDEYF